MGKRVVLAMSGGVDSSVAAALLKEQGYDVLGLFMRTGAHAVDEERRAKTCCSVADAMDARNVADRLDIPFYALDFEREFARIEDYFADEYLAGRTPNPCVMCNIWLKFGKLWSYGKQVGADFVATGHYARIGRSPDGTHAGGPGRGSVQGPVVRPLRPAARAAGARAVPGGRVPQGRDPRDGPPARPAGPRQARQPGDLLRPRRRLPGLRPRPAARARDEGRDRRRAGERRGRAFRDRGVHDRPAAGPGHRLRRAAVRRRDRADRPDRHRGPPRGARQGRPDRLAVQLAGARAGRTGRLPGPDPRPAPRRAGHRRSPPRRRGRVLFETPQPAITPGQVVTVYQDDLVLGGGWIEGPDSGDRA